MVFAKSKVEIGNSGLHGRDRWGRMENGQCGMNTICSLLLALAALLISVGANAAQSKTSSLQVAVQKPIAKVTLATVVNAAANALVAHYVFPDKARKISVMLHANQTKHKYENLSGTLLAARLTSDIYAIAHDKHISVHYDPGSPLPSGPPRPNDLARMRRRMLWYNNGFMSVKRLPGNVGYMKIDLLVPVDVGRKTAEASMAFIINTDALVIDLRDNGGGDPHMVDLLCTYLFPAGKPVHLNDFQRRGYATQKFYTLPSIPGGKSYAGKPVYVLTSHNTFSGGEEFAYDLQTQKRAMLIGEVTRGGANPSKGVPLPGGFNIFVPFGRAVNPITKTNWEGVGVKPDIQVPAAQALDLAYWMALKQVAKSIPPTDPRHDPLESVLKAAHDKVAADHLSAPH